jgi:hypothetical protein
MGACTGLRLPGFGLGDGQGGDGMMARMRLLEAEGVITQGCEQVMRLANDLACLREGRPFPIDALYNAHRSTGGPCRDRWPAARLPSVECTVMSRPVTSDRAPGVGRR